MCEKNFKSCVTKTFKLYERKTLSSVREKTLRFRNLNHLGNLVLAILANLVNFLHRVLAILVYFG